MYSVIVVETNQNNNDYDHITHQKGMSMPIANFNIQTLKLIVEAARKHQLDGGAFSVTTGMLFSGDNFEGGEPLDEDGNTEINSKLEYFWPSEVHMIKEKKIPVLMLVGDQGVYIMSNINHKPKETSSKIEDVICYAEKCNPEHDEDFDENKRRLFGGSDGVVTIPLEWAEEAIQKGKRKLKIKLTKNTVSLVE